MSETEIEQITAFDFGKIVVLEEEHKEDDGELLAHIYDSNAKGKPAYCGLLNSEDKHAKTHPNVKVFKGSKFCSGCGVPFCPDCLVVLNYKNRE